jgi:hypothetical protein
MSVEVPSGFAEAENKGILDCFNLPKEYTFHLYNVHPHTILFGPSFDHPFSYKAIFVSCSELPVTVTLYSDDKRYKETIDGLMKCAEYSFPHPNAKRFAVRTSDKPCNVLIALHSHIEKHKSILQNYHLNPVFFPTMRADDQPMTVFKMKGVVLLSLLQCKWVLAQDAKSMPK